MLETAIAHTAESENSLPDTTRPDAGVPERPGQLAELVAGARRGERWAWDALVARYRPLVRAVASGYRLAEVTSRTSTRRYGCAWSRTSTASGSREHCPGG